MKRFYSFLFLSVFTVYIIAESASYHYHSHVLEKGIVEGPDEESECITCLISSGSSSEFNVNFTKKKYIIVFKESLVYLINSDYYKLSFLNLLNRGPPVTLL
tara:strand:+ start:8290 stop:8595 length:306 start_codon:yes stop_codon:yes gene_type:complete